MIEINLLPKELQWRRFRIKLDKKLTVLLISCLAILLVLAGYSFIYQAGKISSFETNIANYKAEADQYSAEIQKIDEIKLKKEQITARMTAIEILNRNRGYWVDLMEDLIKRVPDYLWLTSVQEAAAVATGVPGSTQASAAPPKSTIEGFSFSLNALATFIVRLKKSEVFKSIELLSIKLEETEKTKAYQFKLSCDFSAPEPVVPASETAQTQGTAGGQF